MEIVRIFAEHLYAIKYKLNDSDEFERLFDSWNDPEYLEDFFERNKEDLKGGFFNITSVEDAVLETIKQANQLEQTLKYHSEIPNEGLPKSLDKLFRPLNKLIHESELAKSKAYGKKRASWLRIYAIKVGYELFIITGGAIKLTEYMNEREHTALELRKLERVVNFLKEQGVIDREGFEELEI